MSGFAEITGNGDYPLGQADTGREAVKAYGAVGAATMQLGFLDGVGAFVAFTDTEANIVGAFELELAAGKATKLVVRVTDYATDFYMSSASLN